MSDHRKRKSCRHPGRWSWFVPLNRGHARVFCVGCAKWADEIRAAKPRAAAEPGIRLEALTRVRPAAWPDGSQRDDRWEVELRYRKMPEGLGL